MPTQDLQQTRFLELLARLGQLVASSRDTDALLSSTVQLVQSALEIERCSILLTAVQDTDLEMRASSSIPAEEWPKIRVPVGHGIAGMVARDGQPLLVEDMSNSPFATIQRSDRYDTRSFICVPILLDGRVAGVINVNNRPDTEPFRAAHLDLMVSVAGFVALSLENARLWQKSESLRQSISEVLESLPIGVLTFGLSGHLQLWNPRLVELLEVDSRALFPGLMLEAVFPFNLVDEIRARMDESIATRRDLRFDSLLERYGSDPLPVEIGVAPMFDRDGTPTGFTVTVLDISLRLENVELRRLDEAKSNFLSIISHELRTPLTAIKGAVHLLTGSSSTFLSQSQMNMTAIIGTNCDRLARLVNNMLDIVHAENNRLELNTAPVRLDEIVDRAVDTLRVIAHKQAVELLLELEPVEAMADDERYFQVAHQLVENAIKFTASGGKVFVRLEQEDGRARLTVRDTGVGLGQADMDRLFTKFYQSQHPLTRNVTGTGLGLYLVKVIVELHGGTVQATPLSDGAQFVAEIPCVMAGVP